MISVILYGRNDQHGYNYHKRLSISVNAIAEVLDAEGDEILFVDYNTRNDLPAILEAIQDTLTEKAKKLIRIFRVRPEVHKRYFQNSPLPLLEPIARNIALKRMNPKNRWVLSTNVDMIFVSKDPKESLSSLVQSLKGSYYSLPRFEIPENIWELSFDRKNPKQTLIFLREQNLHLETSIKREGFLLYDNPGDFQLILREDLLKIGGFDEGMIHGWHVDSNLAKRMSLLGKSPKSLEDKLSSYHCNHTKKVSFLHSKQTSENCRRTFVERADLAPNQSWGLENEPIEEISLKEPQIKDHLSFLSKILGPKKPYSLTISHKSFNSFFYDPKRVLFHLADHLYSLPKESQILYIGYNATTALLLKTYCERKDLKIQIGTKKFENFCSSLKNFDLILLDFGIDRESDLGIQLHKYPDGYESGRKKLKKVMNFYLHAVKKSSKKTKFVGIHARHSDFYFVFEKHLSIHMTSHAPGICYGYPLQKQKRKFSFSLFSKKQVLKAAAYFVVRYLFSQSDRIRKRVTGSS